VDSLLFGCLVVFVRSTRFYQRANPFPMKRSDFSRLESSSLRLSVARSLSNVHEDGTVLNLRWIDFQGLFFLHFANKWELRHTRAPFANDFAGLHVEGLVNRNHDLGFELSKQRSKNETYSSVERARLPSCEHYKRSIQCSYSLLSGFFP